VHLLSALLPLLPPHPPRPPSFPSTTLFRSQEDPDAAARQRIQRQIRETPGDRVRAIEVRVNGRNVLIVAQPSRFWLRRSVRHARSEEHTSELQSLTNLVCRLLLEKKTQYNL